MEEKNNQQQPIISLVVQPEKTTHKPKLVGFELSFYIGKRIFIALFATFILSFSLITFKASKNGAEEILTLEYRDEPNLFLSAVALYLLGVSTDIDLTFPLKLLRGSQNSREQ